MTMPPEKKEELAHKISDLEKSLSDLKEQLGKEQIQEQHEAIDHLDDYLKEIDHKYSKLKIFWSILAKEIRGLLSGSSEDDSDDPKSSE